MLLRKEPQREREQSPTPAMYGTKKSDTTIVAMKGRTTGTRVPCGATGAKGCTRGEAGGGLHVPDTVPGMRVTGLSLATLQSVIPKGGAGCVSAHVRICAGGPGWFRLVRVPTAMKTGYKAWLTEMAVGAGIENPTDEDLKAYDKSRSKKLSNKDWVHPHDPDARIAKMKDGRTHMAHKVEQAVDLDTGAVVAVTVQTTDGGDTASLSSTLDEASERLSSIDVVPEEVVADKGYHANKTMTDLKARKVRSYISEPKRGRRKWKKHRAAQQPTYANRRRIRGRRGKRLLRLRGEVVERTFAHLLETGGLRRTYLRGHHEIRKRLLIHVCGFNMGLLMRQQFGVGTPRALQGMARLRAAILAQV